jgi:hypothetical protein
MTIKSIVQLLAQADATLADNVTGDITAADVRVLIKDFIDTMSPAYGAMSLVSLVVNVTGVPTAITHWVTIQEATAGYYAVSLANGQVARLINGVVPGASDFIIVDGNIEGPNGDTVTISLYKNGVAMGFTSSVSCTGAGEPIGFNIAAFAYTPTVDAVYEVRISGDVGAKTVTNLSIIVQAQPVRDF